jgi:thymidylate kinase
VDRKIIIIEGMDLTGKDTQIKRIVNYYPKNCFHTLHYHAVKSRDNDEALLYAKQTYNEMFDILNSLPDTDFILNRSHYGEYVYGKMYRDYENPGYIFQLERQWRMMQNNAVLIIFVTTDYETLATREDGDSLSKGEFARLEEEAARFNDVYELSVVDPKRKCLINTSGKSIEQVWTMVKAHLDHVYNN